MNVEELAAELIRFNTEVPPGNEEVCAAFLRDYFLDLRLEQSEVVLHRFAEKRANLLVRVGPAGQAGLLLSGHIDVVPSGDLSLWESPPFEPRIRDGKLYGRGASDMKSAVAALVKAIENYKAAKLRRGIIFAATAGEEIGCDGLRALISEGKIKQRDALYGIIGEPTDLKVVRAHKGGTVFRITFHGKSAHTQAVQSLE
jgi:succinyl-diaminopimelate desuccinylase